MILVGQYEVTTIGFAVVVWRPGFGIVLRGAWNGKRLVDFEVFESIHDEDIAAIESALSIRDASVATIGSPQ